MNKPRNGQTDAVRSVNPFIDAMNRKVLFLDGAMGTSIHNYDLDIDTDYLGRENCTEILVKTRPDVIREIHDSFLAVGCDAVETDTFGANKLVFAEFNLVEQTYELNKLAAELARECCQRHSTPEKPRFVIGSMGPGTKLLSLGHTDWDTLLDSYKEQVLGLIDGGADVLLIETAQDILAVKCAVNACLAAMRERKLTPAWKGNPGGDIPIMVQVTIETTGTMLLGTEIAAAAAILENFPVLSIGLNCATGPNEMTEHISHLARHWDRAISVLPNAGLPVLVEGRTEYPLKPTPLAEKLAEFVDDFGVNIVGGCCGTTPEHLARIVEVIGERQPVAVNKETWSVGCTSLFGCVEYRQDNSLLNVGERTNASGSRKFKRLLEEEDWDEMISLAREQVREGSHVVDINVDYAGRNNAADMAEIVSRLVRQVNVPLMLDSTQVATIEAGLKQAGGKCLINSANLEDGEEKFATMCQLAKVHGAGLVLGCIDEDPDEAMARTADRKVEIASRMFKLATEKHGLRPEDLMFDPLVLPISTGMDKDRHSALETIAGTRRIAEAMPRCQITCGLSNVSFGLKPVARQVLNSVFLNELTEAGMTSAIVHVSKILPRNRVDPAQWDAALDLVYDRWRDEGDETQLQDGTRTLDPLQIFIDMFPDDATEQSMKKDIADLPLEEKLQKHIIDGEKKNLHQTLDAAMKVYAPLDIINDHLLAGMKVVGELFGSGQMQLPFVLQSAEVMKMAVAHLEPHMEKADGQTKGTLVLATVKGDVHDIGKNLVDIILSNNGYTVYNIGIKQPLSAIVEKWKETGADAIGMSGLLVKSVNVMEENLQEMNNLGIDIPVILGGAALSQHYCNSHLRSVYKGKLYHGRDAFEGLRLMDYLMTDRLDEIDAEVEARLAKRAESEQKTAEMKSKQAARGKDYDADTPMRSDVAQDLAVPSAPFWGDRVVNEVPLDHITPYVNKIALYRGQWQFKKGRMSDRDYQNLLEDKVEPIFRELSARAKTEKLLKPQVVYGFFPCQSDDNDLIIFDPADHEREMERFSFPRQRKHNRLCISDFFRSRESGEKDVIGLHCVTMGSRVSEVAVELFKGNHYQEYLYMHGFGVECAEALAELWHKRMRQELGIGGDDSPVIRELFTQTYRGSRYSFGYPACPDMADQEKLFRLLKPERIGCELTENWQIDPEQSTSAIIVHHPEAKYFNV